VLAGCWEATAEPKVEGVSSRSIDTWFAELRGQEAAERAHAAMLPALGEPYRIGLVLVSSRHPIAYGSSEAFLEIAGATELRVRIRSGGRDGDATAEIETRAT
jgi:hypothetical protein